MDLNQMLDKTVRYSWNEWALIGACAAFFVLVYMLTKQR
jgi:hypothetical protein